MLISEQNAVGYLWKENDFIDLWSNKEYSYKQ